MQATLGVEQGDVLGPLLFAVAFRKPVEQLRLASFASALYLACCTFSGPCPRQRRLLSLKKQTGPLSRLTRNSSQPS